MQNYIYGFHLEQREDDIFFRFPKFREVISAVSIEEFKKMKSSDIQNYASDAVIIALQGRIMTRDDIPDDDDMHHMAADGFVSVQVQYAMKIELFKLFKENSKSIAQFARTIGKPETAARRLLDLRHRSWASEIEQAIASFGKRLIHNWDLDTALPPARRPRDVISKSFDL